MDYRDTNFMEDINKIIKKYEMSYDETALYFQLHLNGMRKKKVKCECGSVIRGDYKTTHLKTKKHLTYMNE